MVKKIIKKLILKQQLENKLYWKYKVVDISINYSSFSAFRNRYFIIIQSYKNQHNYYLDLEYTNNLKIKEVVGLIVDLVEDNCEDDTEYGEGIIEDKVLKNY